MTQSRRWRVHAIAVDFCSWESRLNCASMLAFALRSNVIAARDSVSACKR